MALILARSIHAQGSLVERDVVEAYRAWFRNGAFDTGPVWHRVIQKIERGTPFDQAARLVDREMSGMTAGANPAHRVTALACSQAISDDTLPALARAEARLTHLHPDAGHAAAATAVIVRRMLRGDAIGDAVSTASAAVSGLVRELLVSPPPPEASGHAPYTLSAAVHFSMSAASFSDALNSAVKFAGVENYCPVLVGAFSALRFGYEEVPGLPVDPVIAMEAERMFEALWR